jgi:hypothetical protein
VDERERRMTQNEALFREVNERVQEKAEAFGSAGTFEYLCECANADCTFQVSLTPAQYESVRADPTQFVVLPLHFTPEIEVMVSEDVGFWIVKKVGEAGDYVEELDPRSQDT